MKIQWLGHSCFLLTTQDGTRILTDPYDETVGYDLPAVEADIVTTSHNHHDHGNVGVVRGDPEIIDSADDHEVGDVYIHGHVTYHDGSQGSERGKNVVFTIEADDLAICHLGDLGHPLSDDDVDGIGPVDILLIPVGGFYTIDAQIATKVVEAMEPLIVIPMHVKNDKCNFTIAAVDPFVQLNKKRTIKAHEGSTLDITSDDLPVETEIHVLQHAL
jgi:L-ascorbate metabolism protein UlaG (beta-lactamase superfamily)